MNLCRGNNYEHFQSAMVHTAFTEPWTMSRLNSYEAFLVSAIWMSASSMIA
jgi:hypothetical protein